MYMTAHLAHVTGTSIGVFCGKLTLMGPYLHHCLRSPPPEESDP